MNPTHTPNVTRRHARATLLATAAALALALFWTGGCATGSGQGKTSPASAALRAELRERWGIEVASLHMSAHGRMVDFRYRVLDPDKAALLVDRSVKPALTDLATGVVLHVPSFPKTGAMRQTGVKPQAGRIYFMLFANSGMAVKSGSRVTISVGAFKAENLTVQ